MIIEQQPNKTWVLRRFNIFKLRYEYIVKQEEHYNANPYTHVWSKDLFNKARRFNNVMDAVMYLESSGYMLADIRAVGLDKTIYYRV